MLVSDCKYKYLRLFNSVDEDVGETAQHTLSDAFASLFAAFRENHYPADRNPQFINKFCSQTGSLGFIPIVSIVKLVLRNREKSDRHFLYFAKTSSIATVFISPLV